MTENSLRVRIVGNLQKTGLPGKNQGKIQAISNVTETKQEFCSNLNNERIT